MIWNRPKVEVSEDEEDIDLESEYREKSRRLYDPEMEEALLEDYPHKKKQSKRESKRSKKHEHEDLDLASVSH